MTQSAPTSTGCLEGAEQEKAKASERQQFDEDDQTNLYMAAHNLKTQNKKGLGTKSQIGMASTPGQFAPKQTQIASKQTQT